MPGSSGTARLRPLLTGPLDRRASATDLPHVGGMHRSNDRAAECTRVAGPVARSSSHDVFGELALLGNILVARSGLPLVSIIRKVADDVEHR